MLNVNIQVFRHSLRFCSIETAKQEDSTTSNQMQLMVKYHEGCITDMQ